MVCQIFTEPTSRRASRDGDELLGVSVDEDDDEPEERSLAQGIAASHQKKATSDAPEADEQIDVPSSEVFENAADDFLAAMRNRSVPAREEGDDQDGGGASSEPAITTTGRTQDSAPANGIPEKGRPSPSPSTSQRDDNSVSVPENESKVETLVEANGSIANDGNGPVPQHDSGSLDGDAQRSRAEDAATSLDSENTSPSTESAGAADIDTSTARGEATGSGSDCRQSDDAVRGSESTAATAEPLAHQQQDQESCVGGAGDEEQVDNDPTEESLGEAEDVDPIEQLKVAFDAVDLDRDGYIEQCEFTDLIRGLWSSQQQQQRNSLPTDYDAAEKAARRGYAALGRSQDMMLRFSDVIRWLVTTSFVMTCMQLLSSKHMLCVKCFVSR